MPLTAVGGVDARARAGVSSGDPGYAPLPAEPLGETPSGGQGAWRRACAFAFLGAVYATTIALSAVCRRIRRRPRTDIRRILATARFDSANWFCAHARPLAHCGMDEVVFVSDRCADECLGVTLRSPPAWLTLVAGRAVAKLLTLLVAGAARRADLYIGYHILPGAISALIAARLLGRRACYQMTGGPTEVIGGGFAAENRVLAALGSPSRLLERLALRLVREFDLIVVRGDRARRFLRDHGVSQPLACVPGSIPDREGEPRVRDIDLVFVGRLSEIKQPLQFIDLVAAVRTTSRGLRAAVVGDGPLRPACQAAARRLGLEDCLEFFGRVDAVSTILSRAKVFVLTSRSEGLSIALAEAMAAGVVPVVADVGDLSTLVQDGHTGYLVRYGDLPTSAHHVERLLMDQQLWNALSSNAVRAAKAHCSLTAVADRWRQAFSTI